VPESRQFFVYIMTNKPWGTLYVGMTNDIMPRVFEHQEGTVDGFTKRYSLDQLVYYEEWPTAPDAIHREKRLKKWPRAWKINLIRTDNPDRNDLAADRYPRMPTADEIENWIARTSRTMTEEGKCE
jgi:putative endonuclease